ncbi:MAG: hypothetical protein R6V03_10140 [Kiritimatiellia bacterium]
MKNGKNRKPYDKPRIVHREKVEVVAATCDSAWIPNRTCMLDGQSGCQKTRF